MVGAKKDSKCPIMRAGMGTNMAAMDEILTAALVWGAFVYRLLWLVFGDGKKMRQDEYDSFPRLT